MYSCDVDVLGEENEINEDADLFWSVFPNPAAESITIHFSKSNVNDQVQIYDAMGLLVKEIETSESTVVNISNLQTGVYFIRLKKNMQPALKLIKQ